MKFFKFINFDDKSLSVYNGQIHYKKGEEIIVPDANSDPSVQCSSGIHCLYMESATPISEHSVLFGPKIAILEAEKEDVIYFSADGKCRLKKCKVIDVIELNDLPFDKLIGNGNYNFMCNVFSQLDKIYLDKNKIKTICRLYNSKTLYNFLLYYIDKIEYNEEIEKALLDNMQSDIAIMLAIINKKYYSSIILDYLCDIKDKKTIIEWTLCFGRNTNMEKNLLPSDIGEYFAKTGNKMNKCLKEKLISSNNITAMVNAVIQLKNKDKDIEKIILSSNEYTNILKYSSHTGEVYPESINAMKKLSYENQGFFIRGWISEFDQHPEVKSFIEESPVLSYYYLDKNKDMTDKMKQQIIKDSNLSYRVLLDYGYYEDFYFSINSLYQIIEILTKHGYNKSFVEYAAKYLNGLNNVFYYNSNIFIDLLKQYHCDENLKALFFMSRPKMKYIVEYCLCHDIDDHAKRYIRENCVYYMLSDIADRIGYIPIMKEILEIILEKETDEETRNTKRNYLEKIPQYYFKIAKRLNNGSVVSAFVTKESKMRKTYLNAGETKTVDNGMVFDNFFNALRYYNVYSDCDDLYIYRCTGDNFKNIYHTINLRYIDEISPDLLNTKYQLTSKLSFLGLTRDEIIKNEMVGSGILENIRISRYPVYL